MNHQLEENNLRDMVMDRFHADHPGEPGYRRVLVRPKINWWRVAAHCVLPVLLALGLYALLAREIPLGYALGLSVGVWALYQMCTLKKTMICAVRIYQRLAPEKIRAKCKYEPSCSEYMILSLEKYGAVKGLLKGIGRLRRCNKRHPGGFDAP